MNLLFTAGSCTQLTAYIATAPDDALTASSQPFSDYGPENSSLFTTGGWIATSASQYIQVTDENTKTVLLRSRTCA